MSSTALRLAVCKTGKQPFRKTFPAGVLTPLAAGTQTLPHAAEMRAVLRRKVVSLDLCRLIAARGK